MNVVLANVNFAVYYLEKNSNFKEYDNKLGEGSHECNALYYQM